MSHFTKLSKANVVDPNAFVKACAELGLTEVRKNCDIKDFTGKSEHVDVACRAPGARYDVAARRNQSGAYDLVADWWGHRTSCGTKLSGLGNDLEVQNAVLRLTTKHTILDRYAKRGFRAAVREEGAKIRVTLTKF
jgi:hypothetical protein